jgi:non-homologous end joining protein Ku
MSRSIWNGTITFGLVAVPAKDGATSGASATTDVRRHSQRPRQLFEHTRADQRPDPPEDEVDTY